MNTRSLTHLLAKLVNRDADIARAGLTATRVNELGRHTFEIVGTDGAAYEVQVRKIRGGA